MILFNLWEWVAEWVVELLLLEVDDEDDTGIVDDKWIVFTRAATAVTVEVEEEDDFEVKVEREFLSGTDLLNNCFEINVLWVVEGEDDRIGLASLWFGVIQPEEAVRGNKEFSAGELFDVFIVVFLGVIGALFESGVEMRGNGIDLFGDVDDDDVISIFWLLVLTRSCPDSNSSKG